MLIALGAGSKLSFGLQFLVIASFTLLLMMYIIQHSILKVFKDQNRLALSFVVTARQFVIVFSRRQLHMMSTSQSYHHIHRSHQCEPTLQAELLYLREDRIVKWEGGGQKGEGEVNFCRREEKIFCKEEKD